MSAPLRISQVADRAGVQTATVRYYERIGVLPVADRSANGYRRYDERTVERLAFIGHLKQLGCSIEEITELVSLGDGGRCRPLQDRLRRIIDNRLAAARSQIAALTAATSQLQGVVAIFDGHTPDGPCDDQCGCRATAPTPAAAGHVRSSGSEPVVCTLSSGDARHRVEQWQQLLGAHPGLVAAVARRLPIPGGWRLEFNTGVNLATLTDLVTAEQDCCRFFRFAITVDDRGVGLEVTAPAEAQPLLEALLRPG